MTKNSFRPGDVGVDETSLEQFRANAEQLATRRQRLSGLAIGFATGRVGEFTDCVREQADSGSTQRLQNYDD